MDALRPCVYGMSAGTIFSRADRYHFGQLRWAWTESGTRQILLASEAAVLSWLKGQEQHAQLADAGAALKEISADGMRSLLSQTGLMFSGTVGPGDTVYIPPGFVICERSQGKAGIGLCQRVLLEDHVDVLKPLMTELGSKLPAKHALRAAVLACAKPEIPLGVDNAAVEPALPEHNAAAPSADQKDNGAESAAK